MTLERFKSRLKTLNSLRILTIEPNLGFKTSIIKYRDDGCLFGICSFASWVRNSRQWQVSAERHDPVPGHSWNEHDPDQIFNGTSTRSFWGPDWGPDWGRPGQSYKV